MRWSKRKRRRMKNNSRCLALQGLSSCGEAKQGIGGADSGVVLQGSFGQGEDFMLIDRSTISLDGLPLGERVGIMPIVDASDDVTDLCGKVGQGALERGVVLRGEDFVCYSRGKVRFSRVGSGRVRLGRASYGKVSYSFPYGIDKTFWR